MKSAWMLLKTSWRKRVSSLRKPIKNMMRCLSFRPSVFLIQCCVTNNSVATSRPPVISRSERDHGTWRSLVSFFPIGSIFEWFFDQVISWCWCFNISNTVVFKLWYNCENLKCVVNTKLHDLVLMVQFDFSFV